MGTSLQLRAQFGGWCLEGGPFSFRPGLPVTDVERTDVQATQNNRMASMPRFFVRNGYPQFVQPCVKRLSGRRKGEIREFEEHGRSERETFSQGNSEAVEIEPILVRRPMPRRDVGRYLSADATVAKSLTLQVRVLIFHP